jgi:hypothetical protein
MKVLQYRIQELHGKAGWHKCGCHVERESDITVHVASLIALCIYTKDRAISFCLVLSQGGVMLVPLILYLFGSCPFKYLSGFFEAKERLTNYKPFVLGMVV